VEVNEVRVNQRTTDPDVIDASPTKQFFISVLIKDIELVRAIADLVDNCVDGARRIRGNGRFDDLFVRIELDQEQFRIIDNCGGISRELASRYAFRFGRPPDTPSVRHSVGQFGRRLSQLSHRTRYLVPRSS
jgi:hypothetical protein